MKNKVVSAADAAALVSSGDTLCAAGFGCHGVPEELIVELEKRFRRTGQPCDLTLLFAAGVGDGKHQGLNRLARAGLIKRVIGGHFARVPKIAKLAVNGQIEAYNLPLGVISRMYRDTAAGLPGTLSKVGIGTFVDPRLRGGKINASTTEDLIEVVTLSGEELLFYRSIPIQVAFLRGTYADSAGNVTMDNESLTFDALSIATATQNSKGLVIVQVERVVEDGSLNPKMVKIPGALVDCVVASQPEYHKQSFATPYDPAHSGKIRLPLEAISPMPLTERKIIARRAAMELLPNDVVNLGIGMPEGIAVVAAEERITRYLTLTAESGIIGGIPASGQDFGAAINAEAVIDTNTMFDYYDGGGLDLTCLGFANCDARGNVNVSRFGDKLIGAGGFINISQSTRCVSFVGTFTYGGLQVAVANDAISIVREGKHRKFVGTLEEITFSGENALRTGQRIQYITERCVFQLTAEGLVLTEIAPGIDLERDILAHMDFLPVIGRQKPMQDCIFKAQSMGLSERIAIALKDRIFYDEKRETVFYNFQGMHIREQWQISQLFDLVDTAVADIGKRVYAIANYDNFHVEEDLLEEYVRRVKLVSRYYKSVSRYSTSAFLRLKLGDALKDRGMSPHIFETQEEALNFVTRKSADEREKNRQLIKT